MIDLLKKYRFNIILLLVLTGLLFFFIPNEESHYLRSDFDGMRNKSQTVLLWTEIIFLAIIFLVFGLKQIKKVTDIFYLAVGLGLIGLSLFFVFDSIFLSTALFLNKLSNKKTVYKTYKVVYVDDKNLSLWDDELNSSVAADQLIKSSDKVNIKVSDTLIVSFKNGLLGFNFDPTIK